jgi:hypothetical protein
MTPPIALQVWIICVEAFFLALGAVTQPPEWFDARAAYEPWQHPDPQEGIGLPGLDRTSAVRASDGKQLAHSTSCDDETTLAPAI